MSQSRYRLSASQVYAKCDAKQFSFETTAALQTNRQSIGQDRALSAIHFGINIQRHGYNLFALGPTGAGKYTLIRETLNKNQKNDQEIFDWGYTNNFQQSHAPISIKLPAGMGKQLKKDLEELSDTFSHIIPKAFQAESYDKQLIAINNDYQILEESAFKDIEKKSTSKNILFIQSETEFTFSPVEQKEGIETSDEEKLILRKDVSILQNELQHLLQQLPKWQQESRLKVKKLNNDIAKKSVDFWISDLKRRYNTEKCIVQHLNAIEENILENIEIFLPQPDVEKQQDALNIKSLLDKYHLNLIVDHSSQLSPPVVYEVNPTIDGIFGSINNISQNSSQFSDFSMIKPGALHKANGGYLILDAYKLMDKNFSWEALKRALASGEIKIEISPDSATFLTPEAIPLDIKIILLGDYHDYFTLGEIDPEFNALFKVIADFEDNIDRNKNTMLQYAELMASMILKHNLRPFHRTAVARIVEQSSRWADNAEKLSTHTGMLQDLMTEADYWASENKQNSITATNINQAIEQKHYRTSRLKSQSQESILRNNTLVETEGEKIGQINALTISDLGEFTYGQPSRITALARLGDGKIIDIEHESNLSGNIHTKGLLILSHFFGDRYLKNKALSFNASIVFEQSYGGIDGDSASAAELTVLMSAIGQCPIKQSIAITGAIDQHGNMLPIGGVNEKIEGFFEICKLRKLSGIQGVIIPQQNTQNLMLSRPVLDAIENNSFHIYAAQHIDHALEILTDLPIGRRLDDASFTANSLNQKIESRLLDFANSANDGTEEEENNDED